MGDGRDQRIRIAAFEFLDRLNAVHGPELPHRDLQRGFDHEGARVPLLGPQGIFRPRVLPEMPLSITTAPPVEGKPRPYEDEFGEGLIFYRYRGVDPTHRDNVGLRLAMKRRAPLIYLVGLVPGLYLAERPVFVTSDDPARLTFTVQVDAMSSAFRGLGSVSEPPNEGLRAYYTSMVQQRAHQQGFRRRVLNAYRETCAVCRLRHSELLDAAHIIPDSRPDGAPVVPNGLTLCKLHHAAFDGNFLGVRPDLVIEVRKDILREKDGPMLQHGLQEFQGQRILVPRPARLRPDPERLEDRYGEFRRAS